MNKDLNTDFKVSSHKNTTMCWNQNNHDLFVNVWQNKTLTERSL